MIPFLQDRLCVCVLLRFSGELVNISLLFFCSYLCFYSTKGSIRSCSFQLPEEALCGVVAYWG